MLSARASAQAAGEGLQTTFAIDDDDPERAIPSPQNTVRNPLQMGYWTMLMADRADAASKRGDHAAALKYYRALAKAVPDRAVGFLKVCASYEALGDWKNAVANCRAALGKGGATVEDHARFVRLLLAKHGALDATEVADAEAVIGHLDEVLATATVGATLLVHQLRCELGVRLEDVHRLEACTRSLAALAPNDPRTITFDWTLAMMRRDFDAAEGLVARASRVGLPEAAVDRMASKLRLEREHGPLWTRASRDPRAWLVAAGLLAALAAAAALIARRRLWRRRRDLAQAA
jgi:hypothetical protein